MVVENEAPFSRPASTSTATITVNVEDRNEPPVFSPAEIRVSVSEDVSEGTSVAHLRAEDPDTSSKQRVR